MKLIKRKLLTYLASKLLYAVTIDDLLRVEGDKVFVGKKELTPQEISDLKVEANAFQKSNLWKLINYNLYWIANHKMIRGANKEIDMMMGNAMTANIDVIEEFITKLKNLK